MSSLSSETGPFDQAIASIGARGRVSLPSQIVEELEWISPGETVDALGILEQPGTVRLVDFRQYGRVVIERRITLIADAVVNADALHSLTILEDRYHRVPITTDRRITLNKLLLSHLDVIIEETGETAIYVERKQQELFLLSKFARTQRLKLSRAALPNLP
jgi:hypothetical protein